MTCPHCGSTSTFSIAIEPNEDYDGDVIETFECVACELEFIVVF